MRHASSGGPETPQGDLVYVNATPDEIAESGERLLDLLSRTSSTFKKVPPEQVAEIWNATYCKPKNIRLMLKAWVNPERIEWAPRGTYCTLADCRLGPGYPDLRVSLVDGGIFSSWGRKREAGRESSSALRRFSKPVISTPERSRYSGQGGGINTIVFSSTSFSSLIRELLF
jgi:hypothetical protein